MEERAPVEGIWIQRELGNDAAAYTYTIASFTEGDAGSYTIDIGDNLTDVASSNPAILVRLYRVPVAGAAGLAVLLGGCLLAGRIVLRRKRP